MTWRHISEHVFPWEPTRLVIAAYEKDDPSVIEVFLCTCADHGNYYPDGGCITIDEIGWVAFAWTDAPPTNESATSIPCREYP